MHVSGTAANYTGLYKCVSTARPADPGDLASVGSDFPSVWKTSGLVQSMVEIDELLEHLKLVEAAGWTVPRDHPDLVPVAVAGTLADLHRHLIDDDNVRTRPEEFRDWLTKGSTLAESLEAGLTEAGIKPEELSRRFKLIAASCKECHVKYRD